MDWATSSARPFTVNYSHGTYDSRSQNISEPVHAPEITRRGRWRWRSLSRHGPGGPTTAPSNCTVIWSISTVRKTVSQHHAAQRYANIESVGRQPRRRRSPAPTNLRHGRFRRTKSTCPGAAVDRQCRRSNNACAERPAVRKPSRRRSIVAAAAWHHQFPDTTSYRATRITTWSRRSAAWARPVVQPSLRPPRGRWAATTPRWT